MAESAWRRTSCTTIGLDRPRGEAPPALFVRACASVTQSIDSLVACRGTGAGGSEEGGGGRGRRRFPSKHKHGLACMRDATPWYAFDTHVGTHQEARGSCIARSMFDCTLYCVSLPAASPSSIYISLSLSLPVRFLASSSSLPVSLSNLTLSLFFFDQFS